MITLRQLKCLQMVVEMGNFSRAAARLNTTQPALSQAIRDLEEVLGVRLLDRTTRSMELTEAGRGFHPQAIAGLEEIERAVLMVQDYGRMKRGLVRIAAPPLLAATILPSILARAAKLYPDLEVRLEDVGTEQILERVRSGRADLGLGTFRPGEEGIESQSVLRDQLMVFLPEGHPLAGCDELQWKDLEGVDFVTLTRDSGLRLYVDAGFEAAGIASRPAREAHQIATVIALALQLELAALLPAYARAMTEGRRMTVRPLSAPVISRELSIIRAASRSQSPASRAIALLITEALMVGDLGLPRNKR